MADDTKTVELVRPDLAAKARKMMADLAEQHDADLEAERRAQIDGVTAELPPDVFHVLIKTYPNQPVPKVDAEVISGCPPDLEGRLRLPRATAREERRALKRLHWAYCTVLLACKYGDMQACRARAARARFVKVGEVPM